MRTLDYTKLADRKWDSEVLSYVARIHECKVRQELFVRQKPVELDRLTKMAKIESIESSNRIEGIVTTSSRVKQLVMERVTPRSRDENEILGYRDVLQTIHESHDYIPVTSPYILQLHRDLLKYSGLTYGGHFKKTQNYICETLPDGSRNTRFMPLEPYETPEAVKRICESYNYAVNMESVDILILIPAFVCDFLCIHPFNDGNGRISRLLTLLLLYQNGYEVGKYISLERQIEKTKDVYYEALAKSDVGWHQESNDLTPFIKYMLKVILACYVEFEERIGEQNEKNVKSTAYDVVRAYMMDRIGKMTSAEVIAACPSAGRSAILGAIKRLVAQGLIVKRGSGRNTHYVRADAVDEPSSRR